MGWSLAVLLGNITLILKIKLEVKEVAYEKTTQKIVAQALQLGLPEKREVDVSDAALRYCVAEVY